MVQWNAFADNFGGQCGCYLPDKHSPFHRTDYSVGIIVLLIICSLGIVNQGTAFLGAGWVRDSSLANRKSLLLSLIFNMKYHDGIQSFQWFLKQAVHLFPESSWLPFFSRSGSQLLMWFCELSHTWLACSGLLSAALLFIAHNRISNCCYLHGGHVVSGACCCSICILGEGKWNESYLF